MRNPIRRSKKIGLTQGGRVKDGRPREKWSHLFPRDIWDKLSEPTVTIRVLRENPSRDNYHPCSAEDCLAVVNRLPKSLTKHLRTILLRRTPQRNEKLGIEARLYLRCVVLNSFPKGNRYIWDLPPTAGLKRHYEPWCSKWVQDGENWILQWTSEEVRRYYMYHLLLHEIGHLNQPWKYSKRRREAYAENFALEWARKLGELK